jgi:hypothetical protein
LLFFPTAAPILVSALAIPALFSSESTAFLVCKINTIKFCRQANQSRDVRLFNDSIPIYILSSYILMAITVIMKLNPTFYAFASSSKAQKSQNLKSLCKKKTVEMDAITSMRIHS